MIETMQTIFTNKSHGVNMSLIGKLDGTIRMELQQSLQDWVIALRLLMTYMGTQGQEAVVQSSP